LSPGKASLLHRNFFFDVNSLTLIGGFVKGLSILDVKRAVSELILDAAFGDVAELRVDRGIST
jgi:hypothetical protein